MSLVQKVGYITIVVWGLWGCQISFSIIYKLYKSYFSLNNALDLSHLGKWAIVTGCSRGIGKAFAEILAKKGLNIVLVNVYSRQYIRQQNSIEHIAENIECLYDVQTRIIHLNISEGLEAYSELEKKIVGLEIGILINNFGQNYPHPEYFLDLPHNDKIYMSIIQCNIVVITNMCRVILPQMASRQKGVIINVASLAAVIPSPLLSVYAATKAYILKFSMDLHMEYSKNGVIIQCLLPASINNSVKSCSTCSSSWISPTPEQYVKNAIATIGKDDITTGFFPHTIFLWIIQLIYKLSPTFIILTITSIMEINRNYAIQRYVC